MKEANILHMAFPPDWGLSRTAEMLALMQELCGLFPFRSGHAGFSLECSGYEQISSEGHAWKTSMRHRGLDIFMVSKDMGAAGRDALKGVNWLTAVGDKLLKKVGGTKGLRKKLSEAIELIDVPGGVLIKAGPKPAVGDTNRNDFVPLYQEVHQALAPVIEPAIERYGALSLWEESLVKTHAWLRRFVP
jgi:hypothetical protein